MNSFIGFFFFRLGEATLTFWPSLGKTIKFIFLIRNTNWFKASLDNYSQIEIEEILTASLPLKEPAL